MIIKKFNEEMKIVKSSEMDNWSYSNSKKENIKTGTKTLDLNLGAKVIELLSEYNLGVEAVSQEKVLEKWQILLPDENNFVEYRVTINRKQNWEDFIDEYEYENNIKYDKLNDEEQEKIQVVYDNLPYDESDDYSAFSVFLPTNIDKSKLQEAAMADASNYLKLLYKSELECVLDGRCSYNSVFIDYIEGLKKFTILKNIGITNNNLELVQTINYRLYKDSKAIYLFEELLGSKSNSSKFFKEWINLII